MKKFLVVGIVSTVIDYAIFALLVYFQFSSVSFAIVIGYFFGFALNFFLARNYVFSKSKIGTICGELIVTLFIAMIGLMSNIVIVKTIDNFGSNPYFSRVVAVSIVLFFNYYARKGFVYE